MPAATPEWAPEQLAGRYTEGTPAVQAECRRCTAAKQQYQNVRTLLREEWQS